MTSSLLGLPLVRRIEKGMAENFARRSMQGVSIVNNEIINLNPATGVEILPRVQCTSEQDMDSLFERATAATNSWRATSLAQRIDLLRQGLTVLDERRDSIVSTMVLEMGKPTAEAQVELDGAVAKRTKYLDLVQESLQSSPRGPYCTVVREPLGTVVILSPWNFPCDEILLLTLPALASGNAVICKPSEVTPLTGESTIGALASVLPQGVLQIAQGDGRVGQALVAHADLIAMTGSTATGRAILRQIASNGTMPQVLLEMGGKDPMVVFTDCTDALLERAVQDAVRYSVSNAGQVCCAIERILVEESVYERFVAKVVKEAQRYRVGNGADVNGDDGSSVPVGPLVSRVQLSKVQEQIENAIEKGARMVYQSAMPENSGGFFCPVTVLADVTETMDMYRHETFGPIVCLSRFDGTEREALTKANDTEYGLTASVYTSDAEKAQRVAQQMEAGQVGINCYAIENMDLACPWVGHKRSGYGFHSGLEGFRNFSVPKTIVSK